MGCFFVCPFEYINQYGSSSRTRKFEYINEYGMATRTRLCTKIFEYGSPSCTRLFTQCWPNIGDSSGTFDLQLLSLKKCIQFCLQRAISPLDTVQNSYIFEIKFLSIFSCPIIAASFGYCCHLVVDAVLDSPPKGHFVDTILSVLRSFFGRIDNTIICFRNSLTFIYLNLILDIL